MINRVLTTIQSIRISPCTRLKLQGQSGREDFGGEMGFQPWMRLVALWVVLISIRGYSAAEPEAQDRFSAGIGHSLFINQDGKLMGWGANQSGQLGIGSFDPGLPRPRLIGPEEVSEWKQVSAGLRHSLAISADDRSLWVTGGNDEGELGLGDQISVNQWTPAIGDTPFARVVAGPGYSLAIMEDGSLCSWGKNDSGQLGLGDREMRLWPTPAGSAQEWARLAAGGAHVIGLQTDGTLWVWGDNQEGQLGLGNGAPARVLTPVQLGDRTDWIAVAAGNNFSMALSEDGTLWVWGNNDHGQLGLGLLPGSSESDGLNPRILPPSGKTEPVAIESEFKWELISAGALHAFGLSQEGVWYAWGDSSHGQAGLELLNQANQPVRIGTASNWAMVTAGGNHGLALNDEQQLYGLGANDSFQLGDGTATSRNEPVLISLQSGNVAAPSILRNPRSRVVQLGATVELSVEATGTEPLSFQWRFNGQILPGATGASLTLANITESQLGSYDVVVRNSLGAVTSAAAELRILIPPRLVQSPESADVVLGGRVSFSVEVDPRDIILGAPEFQWYQDARPLSNNSNIIGAQSSTLILTGVQPSMEGEYRVEVTGPGGQTLSEAAFLNLVTAPVITRPPARQIKVTQGDALELSVAALGSEPLDYQWFFNNEIIPGADSDTLSLTSAELVNEGLYFVRVSNSLGNAVSSPSQVVVESPPSIQQAFGNVVVKLGDTVSLKVEVSGKPEPVIRWKRNGVNIQGFGGTELIISNAGERHQGIYTVQAINPVGSDTVNGSLTVSEAPRILVPPRGGFAANGGSARLSVTASSELPLVYEWFLNDSSIPNSDTPRPVVQNISQSNAGLYFVEVSNQVGVTRSPEAALLPVAISRFPTVVAPGEDVSITVDPLNNPGPLEYTWRLNGKKIKDGSTNPTLTIEEVEMPDAGLYSVTITDGTLTSTLFADELRVSAPFINLQDQFEDSQLVQTDEGELLSVGDNIGATIQDGEPAHAGIEGRHSVWFSWQAPANGYVELETVGSSIDTRLGIYTGNTLGTLLEVASDDDSDSGIYSEVLFGVQAGVIYHVAVDSPSGQEGRIAIELEFTESELEPVEILSQPVEQRVFEGENAQFTVNAQGEGELTYQWFRNGLAIPGAIGTIWDFSDTNPQTVGTYFVTVTDPVTGLVITSEPATLYISENALNGVPTAQSPLGSPDVKFQIAQSRSQGQGQGLGQAQASGRFSNTNPRGGAPVSGFTNRQVYNTFGASTESNEPDHCGAPGGASQWTIFTPPFDGTVVMDTNGSDFDTVLAVYTSATASFDDLVEIACDNNSGTDGLDSRLQFEGSSNETYFVVVDGVNAATGVVILNTNVSPPMGATVSPTIQSVQSGDSASFELTFEAPQENISVRWRKNGAVIDGATGLTLALNSVSQEDAGEYEAVITDSFGAETLATAGTLDIVTPPLIVAQPESLSVFEGAAASFSVTAVADGDLEYQWHFNGQPVATAPNGPEWNINPVDPANAGDYFVDVVGTGGSQRSASVSLGILTPTRILTPPFSVSAAPGSEVVLSVAADGSGPLVYQWFHNDEAVADSNSPTLSISNVSASDSGNYRAQVSGPGGEALSSVAVVTILEPPVIVSSPQSASRFVGEALTLLVEASGEQPLSYQWFKNGQPVSGSNAAFLSLTNLRLSDAGSYHVEVTNEAGKVSSDVAVVNVLTETGDPVEIAEITPQFISQGSHLLVTIRFNSVPGVRYGLDVSENLSDWSSSVIELTADAAEMTWSFTEGIDFNQLSAPGGPRFYRLRQLNP